MKSKDKIIITKILKYIEEIKLFIKEYSKNLAMIEKRYMLVFLI